MSTSTNPTTDAPTDTDPDALRDVYLNALRERLDDPADYWAVIGLLVHLYFARIRHDHRLCSTTDCVTCRALADADELFAAHNCLQQPHPHVADEGATYPYKLIGIFA
jgi:hypothetical protein